MSRPPLEHVVILRCGRCQRELDRVEWSLSGPTLRIRRGDESVEHVRVPALGYRHNVTYKCKCGHTWLVSATKVAAAAPAARNLRVDLYAGRHNYGIPVQP